MARPTSAGPMKAPRPKKKCSRLSAEVVLRGAASATTRFAPMSTPPCPRPVKRASANIQGRLRALVKARMPMARMAMEVTRTGLAPRRSLSGPPASWATTDPRKRKVSTAADGGNR